MITAMQSMNKSGGENADPEALHKKMYDTLDGIK